MVLKSDIAKKFWKKTNLKEKGRRRRRRRIRKETKGIILQ
jgi:hypothetical protein